MGGSLGHTIHFLLIFRAPKRDMKKRHERGTRGCRIKWNARSFLGDFRGSKLTTPNGAPGLARPSSLASRGWADCKRIAQSAEPVSQIGLLGNFATVSASSGLPFGVVSALGCIFGPLLIFFSVQKRTGHQCWAKGRPRYVSRGYLHLF